MTTMFEELLNEADRAARLGDWEGTLAVLEQASRIEPEHAGTLNGIGTCLIQLERPAEAVPYFQKVASLAPGSAEAHNNLGVIYSLTGQGSAARTAYQKAVDLDPEHLPAWKNLSLALLQQGQAAEGMQILAAVVQSSPQDAEALFLLAQCYEEGQDYASARALYEETIKHQPDLLAAQQALARLPQPAAQPIDPARIARPEHARKLASLKSLKRARPETSPQPAAEAINNPVASERVASNGAAASTAIKSVAFYGPPEAAVELRLVPVAQALLERGLPVKVSVQFDPADLGNFDTFVFSRPHGSPELLAALERCAQAGKRTVIDLDEDFLHLPDEHSGRARYGSPEAQSALRQALARVDLVTVASPGLAERYQAFAPWVEVLPCFWSQDNALWEKPAPRRQTINLGVAGTHILPKDTLSLKNDLARLLRKHPHTLLVAAQDLRLYQAFSAIPEERRLFLPAGRLEDYPYLLANFDILLVPQQDTPYNQARSDRPLLEAGARGIPWVASPVPAFKEWGAGGLFAETPGDWHSLLKQLVEDAGLRRELGEAGRQKAGSRKASQTLAGWQAILFG